MAANLSYTLRMKTLFRGWPIMVNDMHTRRRRLSLYLADFFRWFFSCLFLSINCIISSDIYFFFAFLWVFPKTSAVSVITFAACCVSSSISRSSCISASNRDYSQSLRTFVVCSHILNHVYFISLGASYCYSVFVISIVFPPHSNMWSVSTLAPGLVFTFFKLVFHLFWISM